MPAIKLVTFDLDNTLWDVDHVVRRAERRMREWITSQIPTFDSQFPPEAMVAIRNSVLAERPEFRHDLSKLREAVLFEAIRRCGVSDRDARHHAGTAFQVFYEARHDVDFFADALDMLETLAKRYQLAALTNGNADFKRLSLDRYFTFGFSAADVGVGKPAPDMFHAALERARVAPEQAVHVGDHLVDDIHGASQVGMHTIWVNFESRERPAEATAPTHTVSRLASVPASIATIDQRR